MIHNLQKWPKTPQETPAPTEETKTEDEVPPPSEESVAQFEDKIAREELRNEETRYLVDNFLKTAKDYANRGKYHEAYDFALQVLKVDPDHPEALRLKHSYGQRLGFRPDEFAQQMVEAENITKVKAEQSYAEINNRMSRGKRYAKEEEYDQALAMFKQAKELLRWMPYHVADIQGKSRQIDLLIQRTEKKRDQKSEEIKRNRLAQAEQEAKRQENARLRSQQERIQTLFRHANLAFEQEKFELAESFCVQISALDPENLESQELHQVIQNARHAKVADVSRRRYLEEWRKVFEDVEKKSIPIKGVVRFPSYEDWKRINDRGSRDIKEDEIQETPATRKTKEQLSSEVLSMDFTEAPLTEVVDFLRTTTGINIIIDPAVKKEFPEEEALKVDLTVNKLKFKSILDLILDLKGLAYQVDDGVIIISTKKRASEKPVLRLYNVRDLTGKLIDFPAQEINLFASTNGDDQRGIQVSEEEEEASGNISEEQLTDLIKNNIAKNSWDADDRSVDIRGGTLIIRQSKVVHDQIEALLKDLRKSTGLLVTIESRFITVTDDFLEDVGVDWRSLGAASVGAAANNNLAEIDPDSGVGVRQVGGVNVAVDDDLGTNNTFRPIDDVIFSDQGTGQSAGFFFNDSGDGNLAAAKRVENIFDQVLGEDGTIENNGGLSLQLAYVDDIELQTILRAVRKRQRSNIVTAPKLTVFNTQRANVSVITQKAFVQDFEVEVATNAVIADPVIGTVQEGVVLDVRPIISADRKYITLELQPTVAVENAINEEDINLASSTQDENVQDEEVDNQKVTIQLPDLQMVRIKTTVTIPDGGTLLIGGLYETTRQYFESGVPVISDLPIISFLTTRKGTFNRKRALLILIRANITSMEEEEPNQGLNKMQR